MKKQTETKLAIAVCVLVLIAAWSVIFYTIYHGPKVMRIYIEQP